MSDLAQVLAQASHSFPDAIALIAPERAERQPIRWTHREFSQLVAALTADMRKQSTTVAERRIGLLLRNSPEASLALPAIWQAGGVAVPLNPELTDRQVADIFEHAGVELVLVDNQSAKRAAVGTRETLNVSSLLQRPLSSGGQSANANKALFNDEPERLAAILYTSGTTGSPKGVMLSHRNLIENARGFQARVAFGPGDRAIQALPLFHSFGIVASLLAPLLNGAALICAERPFGPEALATLIEHRATVAIGVSGYFHLLHRLAERQGATAATSLRFCMAGGGLLPRTLAERFHELFGVRLDFSYGLTEASPIVTLTFSEQHPPGSVGPPLPGGELPIRDPADGRQLPPSEIGEIFVKGPQVMLGYHQDSAATSRAIDADGWLCTSDLGCLDQAGNLTITGRLSELICVHGQNVFPQDVEAALLEHPSVQAAAVIGHPNPRTGEEVHTFVEIEGGAPIADDAVTVERELRRHCLSLLAPYQTPKLLHLAHSLPRNALGKIQKEQLRKLVDDR